jgi:simple sugar transport system permease protein
MTELIASAMRLMTSIAYVALGESVAERSGMLNIGLEGVMLLTAFTAAWIAASAGSATAGVLLAILAGALIMSIIGLIELIFDADHIVVGIGVNLIGLGVTTVLFSDLTGTVRSVPSFGRIDIPLLSDIPVVGDAFFDHPITTYLLLPITIAIAIIMTRTRWGLRLRAVGETPEAVDAAGIAVIKVRLQAMAFCGAMVGLGGAALAIGQLSGFSENLTAGRGFLALAAVIIGRWKPAGTVAATFLLGIALAVTIQAPTWSWAPEIPTSLLLMFPYVLGLLFLSIQRGATDPPRALGIPFLRTR